MNPQFFHKILEITQIVDLVKGDNTSYTDVWYGFGMPRVTTLVTKSHMNTIVIIGNTWLTSVDFIVDKNV